MGKEEGEKKKVRGGKKYFEFIKLNNLNNADFPAALCALAP